jgi:hypothetical protein
MENIFDTFASPLIGLPVRHIWQGYGSAIFLEFGELRPRLEQDGSASQSEGQMGLMIERSWRIEDRTSIRCGSWSDEALWPDVFALLLGSEVRYVKTFGRLPRDRDWPLQWDAHPVLHDSGGPANVDFIRSTQP